METTFTIDQLSGMVGATITRMKVKVIEVGKRVEGTHETYGPWILQSGIIQDPTGTFTITFDKMSDQSNLAGRELILKSTTNKHGLNGLKVKLNKKTGKPYLNITQSSLIVGVDEESSIEAVIPSSRGQAHMDDIEVDKKINKAVSTVQDKVNHDDRKLGIATAKNRLTQLAGLYDLCWKTVEGMDCFDATDSTLDGEDRRNIATTLFIQSVREGLADKMPVRTLSKFYNEEAIEPSSAKYPGEPASSDPEDEDSSIPF